MRSNVARVVASLAVLMLAGLARAMLSPATNIMSAELAGRQFENSDAAALQVAAGLSLVDGIGGAISLATLVALALIWLTGGNRRDTAAAVAALGMAGALGAAPTPASAFFEKANRAEAITIMPNESAFWIPNQGANKDTQTSFDSEAYLAANKIPLKLYFVPHGIFRDSGGTGWLDADYWVPTGRMIIVDRAPYHQEWTKATDRGTSKRDESFPCQSKEGLNITAEVAVAASVTEENAARFLHFFGTNNPPGDRSDPRVIFTSVYYGRSLTQVMQTIGRGLIQTQVCREIGARTFDEANRDYNAIMDAISAKASAYLATRGITVDYLGWAGTFGFDADVQRAVNDRYTAERVQPVIGTLQAKAVVDALEGWDRKLPNSLTLLDMGSLTNAMAHLVHPAADAAR